MTYILYYIKDKKLKITEGSSVMDDLYYHRATIPEKKHIKDASKKIKAYFKAGGSIQKIKDSISRINNKIPLYHEYSENLYIIDKTMVYDRVVYKHYRFPTTYMVDMFKKKLKKRAKNKIEERKLNKLKMMIKFLNSFNLDILYDTYVKVFYHYANEVGKNLTICLRPSFTPQLSHIDPYYTRSELINMALNMGIIKESKIYYDQKRVMGLCEKIQKNDIRAKTILHHQKHIIESDMLELVQYYSLQGSYFINNYLRGLAPYKYKNTYLEKKIKNIWKLIRSAPAFDRSYTLYRFIGTDDHLTSLSIGNKYTSPSFISTTRDPFYRSDEYKFGFILIKIHIPKNIKGVALCIETTSHFPKEQEIILPPGTVLRLDKKDQNASYYHTDNIFASKIKTRYEFTYVGNKPISFVDRPIYDKISFIDFLNMPKDDTYSMEERIKSFVYKYTVPFYNFDTKIGEKTYNITCELYNSSAVYKDFYAAKTDKGFSMYVTTKFMIEIGEDNDGTYMYVNYYYKHSQIRDPISDKDLVFFLSTVGYYFGIEKVLIYTNYTPCNNKTTYGGNYCSDIYAYLKTGKKRYNEFDPMIIKPVFSYYQLDRLKSIHPKKILSRHDMDELYQIYSAIYKDSKNKQTIADFYIWLVEQYCALSHHLLEKMRRVYKHTDNPMNEQNRCYVLDTGAYLYNNKHIPHMPTYDKKSKEHGILDARIPQNRYRVRDRLME